MNDIQKALNVVRSIERQSELDIRLDTLALITSTATDIVNDLRKTKPNKPVEISKVRPLPIPKPTPATRPPTHTFSEPLGVSQALLLGSTKNHSHKFGLG